MGFSLRSVPLYVRISTNAMEVLRLDTGKFVTSGGGQAFSNARLVVAHFPVAEQLLKDLNKELVGGGVLTPNLSIVVQQTERIEGGLCSVEQRSLMDLCEFCGAKKVRIVLHERRLTASEALEILRS